MQLLLVLSLHLHVFALLLHQNKSSVNGCRFPGIELFQMLHKEDDEAEPLIHREVCNAVLMACGSPAGKKRRSWCQRRRLNGRVRIKALKLHCSQLRINMPQTDSRDVRVSGHLCFFVISLLEHQSSHES